MKNIQVIYLKLGKEFHGLRFSLFKDIKNRHKSSWFDLFYCINCGNYWLLLEVVYHV